MANANYMKAQERIKEENGGELPSDLYLQTNEQLTKLLYDLTGKSAAPRTSKKILVGRVERATSASEQAKSTTTKRKETGAEEKEESTSKKSKKPPKPRGCLLELSAGQIAQMKRMMKTSTDDMNKKTHSELRPMWDKLGMTAKYPNMTGKATVIERMKSFAEKNLAYHKLK